MKIIGRYCERVTLSKGRFDPRSFRWKKTGRAWLLVGCRKGSWRRGACQTGMATHAVLVRSNKACRTGERALTKGMTMKRRGLGGDDAPFSVKCYFTRVFSDGLDEAKSFSTEREAMTFAKKCVKDGRGAGAHALVDNHYAGVHKTIARSKTGRLQTKARRG